MTDAEMEEKFRGWKYDLPAYRVEKLLRLLGESMNEPNVSGPVSSGRWLS